MNFLTVFSQLSDFAFTLLVFVIALSVIVAVHEYGHYIIGRWSGIKAEVFSLGFGPVVWSGTDKRGTRWQIAALPFGGYVKFLGDANAASGKDGQAMANAQMDPVLLRQTMHGAPLWARSATVVAGPVFNFLLSIIVFGGLMFWTGQVKEPVSVAEIPEYFQSSTGLRVGDEILQVAGEDMNSSEAWTTAHENLPLTPTLPYLVRRDGTEQLVEGPYLIPSRISMVHPRSAADDAGLKPDDMITAVDGVQVFAFEQLKERVEAANGQEVELQIQRGSQSLTIVLTPRRTDLPKPEGGFETRWLVGIQGGDAFTLAHEPIPVWDAAAGGAAQVWNVISSTFDGISHMISGQISTCNLSGPVGIAQTTGSIASQSILDYIGMIAVLSTAIGLMNLMPVPVLDGGHLVFYAYEAVTGRTPNDRIMQWLMTCGIVMVLSLMLFSVANDFLC